jgi:hypothetical protein
VRGDRLESQVLDLREEVSLRRKCAAAGVHPHIVLDRDAINPQQKENVT